MKLDDLIAILQNARKTLPGDAPVCFSNDGAESRRNFDFGEQGRNNYCLCATIMETDAHTDEAGRFHIPIREIVEPVFLRTPTHLLPKGPETDAAKADAFAWIKQQYTTGVSSLPQTPRQNFVVFVDNQDGDVYPSLNAATDAMQFAFDRRAEKVTVKPFGR